MTQSPQQACRRFGLQTAVVAAFAVAITVVVGFALRVESDWRWWVAFLLHLGPLWYAVGVMAWNWFSFRGDIRRAEKVAPGCSMEEFLP